MTIQEIINVAFKQRLLVEPPPFSTTFIIVDTDGSIVSVACTHEFMEDSSKDVQVYVIEQLLLKRHRTRTTLTEPTGASLPNPAGNKPRSGFRLGRRPLRVKLGPF